MALRLKGSYGLALLFTTGIVGWMATGDVIVSGNANEQGTPPPAVREAAIETETMRVAVEHFVAKPRQSILTVRGRTEADTKVTVRSETTAIVRRRLVEKGQWVKKGDLLCELDTGSRQARLAQAQASLAQAEFDLNAKEALFKKGFAPQTQITALRAQKDAALAQVKEARLELERIKITAPLDGLVQGSLAEIGDQLKSGDACATLMNPDPMLIIGQISERDIGKVIEGAKAQVRLVTGEETTGTVRYVAKTSDVETRTFRVEVKVDNKKQALRDGVTAVAKITLPAIKAHQMSPAHLTLSDDGLIGVMTVKNETTQFTPVTILANGADGIWIVGLPDVIDIVTVGQEYVTSGQQIVSVDASELAASQAQRKPSDEEAQQ